MGLCGVFSDYAHRDGGTLADETLEEMELVVTSLAKCGDTVKLDLV